MLLLFHSMMDTLLGVRDAPVVEAVVVESTERRLVLDVVEVLQGDVPTERLVYHGRRQGGHCRAHPDLVGETVLVYAANWDMSSLGRERRFWGCPLFVHQVTHVGPWAEGVCVSQEELADAYRLRRELHDTIALPWPFRPVAAPREVQAASPFTEREDCELREPGPAPYPRSERER